MTEAEHQQLRELSNEIAEIEKSAWQPSCIARAFAPPAGAFTFTMQVWIALDLARSPLLEYEPLLELTDFEAALKAFGYPVPEELTAAESVILGEDMLAAVREGFSSALRMDPPGESESLDIDGFGPWLPIFTALITQCNHTRLDALACPVAQAFQILAAAKHNLGWRSRGTPYALRDIGAEPKAEASVTSDPEPLTGMNTPNE